MSPTLKSNVGAKNSKLFLATSEFRSEHTSEKSSSELGKAQAPFALKVNPFGLNLAPK